MHWYIETINHLNRQKSLFIRIILTLKIQAAWTSQSYGTFCGHPGANGTTSVGEEFQDRVLKRDVGTTFTAYRNPVVADVFWGIGYVDKAGSGLMDAVHSLKEMEADAKIRVPDSNEVFSVTISMPSIEIDDSTQTAIRKRPALYYSNLVEFYSVPSVVWAANSHITKPRDAALFSRGNTLPAFSLRNSRLYSFANLSSNDCLLRSMIDPQTIEECHFDDVMSDSSTETLIPELLRKILEYRMSSSGMRVDRRRSRAYYACYNSSARSISYQATRQRTSRRVARWPERLGIGYCEHSAVNYRVVRIRDSWGLMLQPTYVITTDGKKRQIPFREHSRIVTRLMSDHYNPKVLADVRFWISQLETEPGIIRIQQDDSPPILINTHLITHEGFSAPGQ